jgi:putative addiction module killer protein
MTVKYELIVYNTVAGREPFQDWLNSLDQSVLWKIESRMERLQYGHFGDTKSLKEGLFELRFKNPAFRIYYALIEHQIVLLICGGDKNKQSADIKKSKEYLDNYRSRCGIEKK